jgi:hypothetical protein
LHAAPVARVRRALDQAGFYKTIGAAADPAFIEHQSVRELLLGDAVVPVQLGEQVTLDR